MAPELRAAAARKARHEQIIVEDGVAYAMAGMADTAKYTMAAANAARYAAGVARKSGARGAARRADRAAADAISWASHVDDAAATSDYAPYSVMMAANAARRAAIAARGASLAAGPLGRYATRLVGIAVFLLPHGNRARYQEEWKSDLCTLPDWRARCRYILSMLIGAMRLAVVLRVPVSYSGSSR
jgi:hypothetical protein